MAFLGQHRELHSETAARLHPGIAGHVLWVNAQFHKWCQPHRNCLADSQHLGLFPILGNLIRLGPFCAVAYVIPCAQSKQSWSDLATRRQYLNGASTEAVWSHGMTIKPTQEWQRPTIIAYRRQSASPGTDVSPSLHLRLPWLGSIREGLRQYKDRLRWGVLTLRLEG